MTPLGWFFAGSLIYLALVFVGVPLVGWWIKRVADHYEEQSRWHP